VEALGGGWAAQVLAGGGCLVGRRSPKPVRVLALSSAILVPGGAQVEQEGGVFGDPMVEHLRVEHKYMYGCGGIRGLGGDLARPGGDDNVD
jgi:hypothetical protein